MDEQTNLPADSELALKIRDRFFGGLPIETLKIVDSQKAGQCYTNVRKTVSEKGGKPYFGWALTYVPNYFVEALHHCVWEKPDSHIVDVTAIPFAAFETNEITFIPQNDLKLDDVYEPTIPSLFVGISNHSKVKKYIKATRGVIIAKRKFHNLSKKIGA